MVPYNIASAAALLKIIAQLTGMLPGELVWVGGDTHIYDNHQDAIYGLFERTPRTLPAMTIDKKLKSIEDIENLVWQDFVIEGYNPYPPIKAELNVGI